MKDSDFALLASVPFIAHACDPRVSLLAGIFLVIYGLRASRKEQS